MSTLTTEELNTAWNAVRMAFDYVDLFEQVYGENVLENKPVLKSNLTVMLNELNAWHNKYGKEVN